MCITLGCNVWNLIKIIKQKKISCSDLSLTELGYCVNLDSYQEVEISCIFVFLKVFRKGQGK